MPLVQTRGAASAQGFGEFAQAAGPAVYIEDVFSTYLYTGNSTARSIVNNIDLSTKGGLVWAKSRSNAYANCLTDTVRGNQYQLVSNNTDAQLTGSPAPISSFNTDGFSLPATTDANDINFASATYCSWTFREQAKFFDVVTGTGGGTFNHSLGVTPGMIMIKLTSGTSDWWTVHRSSNGYFRLNLTNAAASTGTPGIASTGAWVNASSTTFSTSQFVSSGESFVAYLFAHDAGGFGTSGTDNVISCGSFTTTAGGAVPTVTLGYEPQYLMLKCSSAAGNWNVIDNMRAFSQTQTLELFPNSSTTETDFGVVARPTATGFTSGDEVLAGSETFIYMAIRRPMKPPTSGTEVFSPVARTGNGSTASITGINFAPDVLLCSSRAGYWEASFNDRLRGFNRTLYTQLTSAESTNATSVTAMGNTSISLGAFGSVNASGQTYINWILRRASEFFDEVCYTGNDTAGRTVTHNLNSVPELMIIKDRTVGRNWIVYSSSTGNTKYLVLNQIAAPTTSSTIWNDTSPTSTVFTLGSGSNVNSSAENYVAYLFATLAGVSKVGSYTGTGTTQTINCGFTGGARFVLIKRTDDSGDWYVYDTARGMVSGTDPFLLLNTLEAETNQNDVFTTTTGFQLVSSFNGTNRNAASYIFLAIA